MDQQVLPETEPAKPQITKTENVQLTFQELSYTVLLPKDNNSNAKKGPTSRLILNNLTGICHPGEITAILGASGAGKTSLLNILARRINTQRNVILNGDLLANKQPYSAEQFPSFAAYVMQNDILFGTLTVREALSFVANLKYANPKQKIEKVNEAIKTLKLEKCADTLIGNNMIKGISGGERKRTSIGVELVNDPYCILLDEPTSGLDSFTAFIIINLLKTLAKKKNRTVVFTIHQPSSDIFQLFDKIMLLVQGQFIYQGPRNQLVQYFQKIGYPCPEHSNPLDYLMELMHVDNPKHADFQQLYDFYFQNQYPAISNEVNSVIPHIIEENRSQTSFLFQVGEICRRGMINVKRDKLVVRGRLVMIIFLALLLGGIYWGAGRKDSSFQKLQSMMGGLFFCVMNHFMGSLNPVMIQFPAEREVFLREENSRLYTTAAYFTGKSSVEIPFLLIFPIIQQIISYWMVGWNDNSGGIVVTHIFICILLGLCGNSVGLMAGSMFKDVRTASGMLPMVLMPLILFSGFWANQSQFMNWIGWIQYLSPLKYAYEALVTNEYSGMTFKEGDINDPDPIAFYDFVLGLWPCVGILVAYIVAYRFVALLFLYLLREKQQ